MQSPTQSPTQFLIGRFAQCLVFKIYPKYSLGTRGMYFPVWWNTFVINVITWGILRERIRRQQEGSVT
jgi:hypothetical protein